MKRIPVLVVLALGLPLLPRLARAQCPQPAVTGTQPCDGVLMDAFSRAAANALGTEGPGLGTIGAGRPAAFVPARFPCALLSAVGQSESSWRQFVTSGCGAMGPTLISFDCGYGIMQITSGMSGGAGFDPPRVAAEPVYDVGTGALILGEKWNATPYIGANNPDTVEDWYYATWAYNSFAYVNNPNNPRFPAGRQPYLSPGGLARSQYPYQEIVWGYLQYPPAGRWPSIPVTYPALSGICSTSGCAPGDLPEPTPTHTGDCLPITPADGGDAAPDAPADVPTDVPPDVPTDAPPDVGTDSLPDDGNSTDASDAGVGSEPGEVYAPGCGCRTARTAATADSILFSLAALAGFLARSRRRRS